MGFVQVKQARQWEKGDHGYMTRHKHEINRPSRVGLPSLTTVGQCVIKA